MLAQFGRQFGCSAVVSTTSRPDRFAFAVELDHHPHLMLDQPGLAAGRHPEFADKFWVNAAAPILLNIAMVVALAVFNG